MDPSRDAICRIWLRVDAVIYWHAITDCRPRDHYCSLSYIACSHATCQDGICYLGAGGCFQLLGKPYKCSTCPARIRNKLVSVDLFYIANLIFACEAICYLLYPGSNISSPMSMEMREGVASSDESTRAATPRQLVTSRYQALCAEQAQLADNIFIGGDEFKDIDPSKCTRLPPP